MLNVKAAGDLLAKLSNHATSVRGDFPLRGQASSGSVGAALITSAGAIHTGVCLDFACGLGFCAEHSAIAEMLKHRESEVTAIVAIGPDGVLAPCGRCRELLAQVSERNFDTLVALPGERITTLRDLLPEHWLGEIR